jgi:TolB-like protein/Tfp pilus assembly protein PilF
MEAFGKDLGTEITPETALVTALRIHADNAGSHEFKEALDDALDSYPARTVQMDAHGAVVLFDGSIRSLKAAEHLGRALTKLGVGWSSGLHSGECTFTPPNISGIAVDVASAICRAHSSPGIRLTSTVQELVAEAGLSFDDVGSIRVPGIDFTWRLVEWPLVGTPAQVPSSTPSIAVLPFANMSADPENEFFADGLAEELINALTKIEGLRVAARTSAFSFKGKDAHVRDVGRQLDVGTILEGSVRRSGNKVRVTAQLVKCDDGYHLWSERFDRDLDDVFQIQDEITEAIVEHLKVRLLGGTSKATVRRPTVNVDALTLYQKGRYFWNKRTESNLDRGVEYFEEALKIDPGYPMAHVGLADAQNLYGFYNLRPPGEAFPRAREAAERALALDSSLAAAHTSVAYVQFYHDWNWDEAEKTFLHAQSLDPSYAFAFSFHGNLLLALRRNEEAVARWTHSLKLDPLATIQNLGLGWAHYHAGQFEQAIESMRGALEMDPAFMVGHLFIGRAYEHAGQLDRAVSSFEKAAELSERMPNTLAELGRACAKTGDRVRATALLEELEEAAARCYVSPYDLALMHMALGNADLAFELMDRAADIRSPDLVMMNVDARMNPFRDDPRFASVVKKVGLPS